MTRWSELILYVDRAVIVLNKPPGLVTQHSEIPSVIQDLQRRLQLPQPPLGVHRLDKATTGALVLARSKRFASDFHTQFKQRDVHKTYLALVRAGRQSFEQTSGTIRVPIVYKDGHATATQKLLPGADNEAREALTGWELVASSPHLPLSLLRLKLITGNKHQLRVHLAHVLKTPILGDTVHSLKPPMDSIQRALLRLRPPPESDRMFLHAAQVSFFRYKPAGSHRRFRLRIGAPLPDDFHQLCKEARIPLSDEDVNGGLAVLTDGEYKQVPNGLIGSVDGQWMPDDSWIPKTGSPYEPRVI
ncbi:Pseudouridine synthase [Mycena indigotica]|uniref:21S rRNA pseudouridine(2819) synthase n=1 Tax=Mycena indigotica TaxID=2126181 RepID=A0A8H6SXJ7_9AGAR|nr:Pseudouridine synthase [Mycena indigotica]KAF7306506.1 Pseudouridine synthase [Mycena indigotica]